MLTISDLRQRQALPLGAKILMSQSRIREWYNHFDGDVYVSFSGGKKVFDDCNQIYGKDFIRYE